MKLFLIFSLVVLQLSAIALARSVEDAKTDVKKLGAEGKTEPPKKLGVEKKDEPKKLETEKKDDKKKLGTKKKDEKAKLDNDKEVKPGNNTLSYGWYGGWDNNYYYGKNNFCFDDRDCSFDERCRGDRCLRFRNNRLNGVECYTDLDCFPTDICIRDRCVPDLYYPY